MADEEVPMSVVLHHHPYSRASNVVWMLEELEIPYQLRFVDLRAGAQKAPEMLALNPMGKVPVLVDGDAVVTEGAAIALYLADRYGYGRLAPRVDDPMRAAYLRWSVFAPAVIEPGTMARSAGWAYTDSQAGWGTYEAMLTAMERAVADRDYILGATFSMADVVFGGTVRYLLRTKVLEPRPTFTAYAERLAARPAFKRAEARNAAIAEEQGLNR
jgi:glutathione S-transferase